MKSIIATVALVSTLAFITSCGTTDYNGEKSESFLTDYSKLKANNNSSEALAWQWRDKELVFNNYHALYIEPLIFYPKPQVNNQVSMGTLEEIRDSTDSFLRVTAASQGVPLVTQAGPGVLILRSAITSAQIKLKGFSLIELIPIRMVFSGAELALGKRDRDFELLFEYQLIDSVTNKVVFSGVQYSPDIILDNDKDRVSPEDSKLLLKKIIGYLDRNFKKLSIQLNN